MAKRPQEKEARMLGIGLDNQDGHVRITRGPNFTVVMGSEETHDRLQGTCQRINERLQKKGRRLADLNGEEFASMVQELGDP